MTNPVESDVPTTTYAAVRTPLDGLFRTLAKRLAAEDEHRAKELERFFKFVVVGTIGAIVDFTTFNVLESTILPPSSDFNVGLATTIAFIVAVINNFIWNRYWTYPDSRSRPMRQQLAQFALVNFIGWLMRTAWITLSYHAIGTLVTRSFAIIAPEAVITAEAANGFGSNIALLIGMVFVMLWNFFVNRYWTYSDVK